MPNPFGRNRNNDGEFAHLSVDSTDFGESVDGIEQRTFSGSAFDGDNNSGDNMRGDSSPMHFVDTVASYNSRTVYISSNESSEAKNGRNKYKTNYISTAKYNLITFVPKFLFEQFSRYANLFFLFIAVIQQIPGVSPTGRWTTIIPLSCVLLATAVKEILEDWKRHRQDKEVNDRLVRVLKNGVFRTVLWQNVKVGDIVRVVKDQFLPADIVLISTSEPQGVCYIETSNLDGETNLKIRQACSSTKHVVSAGDARFLSGHIACEPPNDRLYNFKGVLYAKDSEFQTIEEPLAIEQILLRGAQLRNTNWAYGVVVYTGHDAKLLRNTTTAPLKRTQMETITNNQIVFLFIILLVLALISAAASAIWLSQNSEHWYLQVAQRNFGYQFLTFIILYNNLIPISLIVTIEIVKYIQALLFIQNDLMMYSRTKDMPANVRTSALNEELGQIKYVFSDKTGTLTCNVMEFKKCSIGGIMYGALPGEPAPEGTPDQYKDEYGNVITSAFDENGVENDINGFFDPNLLTNLTSGHKTAPVIRQFLTLLAVCHTVIPEVSHDDPDKIVYQAQSPDEGALVSAVKQLGFSFNLRTPTGVSINVLGQDENYELLNVLEFTSSRKRMSVIVKTPQGTLLLMCKGADNVIYERLAPNQPFLNSTTEHLEKLATSGLRTLCLAVAEIDPAFYDEWSKEFNEAIKSLGDREAEIAAVCEKMEKNLFLLGATAIEDKLQDKVPETINNLLEAGIKLWVLTGDKQETAINIAYSCKLFDENINLMVCGGTTKSSVVAWINDNLDNLRKMNLGQGESAGLGLVIDGVGLTFALQDDIKILFLELVLMCKSVVCCRVSPIQKSEVVTLVKNVCKDVTLAIGDGANDVGMIQAAHVGVGISGEEGLQAARSADYAIAEFKFLQRLLLVHGHWSYRRLSKLVLYSFYKNIALYIIQFWFAIVNGFSGQALFDEWMLSVYNISFTFLPPLCMGIFERPVKANTLMRVPQLYRSGINSEFFNVLVFWQWFGNAVYHSAIVFWLVFAAFANAAVLDNGQVVGQWVVGTTVFTAVFVVVTVKAGLIFDTWTVYTFASMALSIVGYIAFIFIYFQIFPSWGYDISRNVFGVQYKMFGSAAFWFSIIIVPIVALARDFVWKACQHVFFPRDYHIVSEMESMNKDPTLVQIAKSFKRVLRKIPVLVPFKWRGFAFSQEERKTQGQTHLGQADLIRNYDTTKQKPEG